jgi:glucose-6-phosphate 1-dehydrogenase
MTIQYSDGKVHDATIVIFGITGDLAKRKLLPAIYKLAEKKCNKALIIGIARSDSTAEQILTQAKAFIPKVEDKTWEKLRSSFYYNQTDFNNPEDYIKMKEFIEDKESAHDMPGNRIYYFATPTDAFGTVAENLSKYGIIKKSGKTFSRIVFEKPFGHDLKSAGELNAHINKTFKEEEIYRIDHYLGKELVGNIALIRFTNKFLEPLWNSKNIEHVEIIMIEKMDIEERGKFYDKHGALKDVVQNHVLQLLALTAMEEPKMLTGEYIRAQKAKVLNKTKVTDFILGQYEGYKSEQGVDPKSDTETFAALRLEIDTPRWKGVPFYIKAGKSLDKKNISIHLKFKHTKCLLMTECPEDTNYFDISIQPDEGFSFELNTKIPGEKYRVTPVEMGFKQTNLFENTSEAYEILIEDICKGDQSMFVRNDEIEYSWKIIDTIAKEDNKKIYPYQKGSSGPDEFQKWSTKNHVRWRR